ncbi:MAG: hypothetical protein PVH68_10370 [Armatimonadota bacterium]
MRAALSLAVGLLVLGASVVLFATGCEAVGARADTGATVICPECGAETTVVAIEDMDCDEGICPECGSRYEVWDGFAALHSEAHVCLHCGLVVEPCRACAGH